LTVFVVTVRTLDFSSFSQTSWTSSTFSSVIFEGLPEHSQSSTVPVSQNRWHISVIQTSLSVILSDSTWSFRFTMVGDSNLAINKTIFILMFIGKNICLKIFRTKL
jgi:hypothetical protein